MFARVLTLLPLAFLVSASNARLQARQSECSTGVASCCSSSTAGDIRNDSSSSQDLIQATLGLADGESVYSDCSPASLLSLLDGCEANQDPVCCNSNSFNSLIGIDCSPINIGL